MSLHPLLKQQFEDCRQADGQLDLRKLLHSISAAYSEWDRHRHGAVHLPPVGAEETGAFTRVMHESTAGPLQAILDHVKDAIITVDEVGSIETLNITGERVFGYAESEVRGQRIDALIPTLGRRPHLMEALDELSRTLDDTRVDLAPRETKGRRNDGSSFDAEIGVSKVVLDGRDRYVVCLRDTTERSRAEAAIRESEARYRTLVEHAPEAIVVLDVDLGHFVECNENAVRFFKLTREALLASGPEAITPAQQPDGRSSQGGLRVQVERALAGEAPCYEWTHRDTLGQDIPCEVRLVRLPSSGRRLVRGSITDITERKRADLLAAGERRVFGRIADNLDLPETLEAIAETAEQVIPDALGAVSLFDQATNVLHRAAGCRLPEHFQRALDAVPVGPRNGSCAAAIYLQRQVVVAEIGRDALWQELRNPAMAAALRACWSTPIRASDGRMLGTVALYFRTPRSPLRRDFDLMSRLTALAAIAIERKQAEQALRSSEARYRGLFENVIEGVYRTTADGRLESGNPALVQMLGYEDIEELLALPDLRPFYQDPVDRERVMAALDRDGVVRNAEYRLRRRDGSLITVIENARVVRDSDGTVVGYEGTLADITERKLAEIRLSEEKEKAQVTLQSIGDAVITADAAGCVEYLNPVAEDLTGWTSAEACGHPVADVFHVLGEASRQPLESPILRCLREGRGVEIDEPSLLVNRRGQEISIQDSAAPIRDRNGSLIGAVMVFHDVSQERRLQRALAHQASHDQLTGLINRREFENRLSAALESARAEPPQRHVLLYLDLDQFKVVNDTCGHEAGDRLLRQVTSIVQSRIRASDTLARLGGDEFGVLLADCTVDGASRIAETLRQEIREFRFLWQDRIMKVGVSIGLAEIDGQSETVAALMSAADVACYSAKDSGRNRVQIYQQGGAPERHREMQWVSRINRACEEDRLELLCQTIVPISVGVEKLRHFELLLRMRDEQGELVQPSEFIPAAERFNLMPTIDRWVVRHACARLAHRRGDESREPYTLGVNISASSLNDEQFLGFVIAEIEEANLAPGALCFELTEAAATTSLAAATHFMRELRARGCRFTLDDFGSGVSSFIFLKSLAVDFLKLDGQFMHNVTHDHVDRGMVGAIARVAESMGIRTIAEKVDSADVLARLSDAGIDYAQGNYIGEPQPVAVLESLVRVGPEQLRLEA